MGGRARTQSGFRSVKLNYPPFRCPPASVFRLPSSAPYRSPSPPSPIARRRYTLESIRGDKVGWFNGDPCHDPSSGRTEAPLGDSGAEGRCWRGQTLQLLMKRLGTLVQLLASQIPELQGIESRSEAMVTCYPGNGSKYIKHSDNPHKNGRKLTVLYYLNHAWKKGDGGEIRVYDKDNATVVEDVAPIADRVLVFYSDTRVPHEVLPTNVERFAVTHWFYDHRERNSAVAAAQSSGHATDLAIEQQRIEQEIAKFEQQEASAASVSPSKLPAAAQPPDSDDETGDEAEPPSPSPGLSPGPSPGPSPSPSPSPGPSLQPDRYTEQVHAEISAIEAARKEAEAADAAADAAAATARTARKAALAAERKADEAETEAERLAAVASAKVEAVKQLVEAAKAKAEREAEQRLKEEQIKAAAAAKAAKERLEEERSAAAQAEAEAAKAADAAKASGSTRPRYTLEERPGEYFVCVELPGVQSSREVVLDVDSKWLDVVVESELHPYRLRLDLSLPVQPDGVAAKFKKKIGTLQLTLPFA